MIENKQLTVDIEPIYTSPGTPGDVNVQSAITTLIFCNTTDPDDSTIAPTSGAYGGDTNIDVYLVKAGATPDPTVNAIIKNMRVPAGETVFFDTERIVLGAGESIQARSSENNKVIATVSILPV